MTFYDRLCSTLNNNKNFIEVCQVVFNNSFLLSKDTVKQTTRRTIIRSFSIDYWDQPF